MQVMTLHLDDAEPFQFGDGMRDAVLSLELRMRDVMATVGPLDLDAHQRKMRCETPGFAGMQSSVRPQCCRLR